MVKWLWSYLKEILCHQLQIQRGWSYLCCNYRSCTSTSFAVTLVLHSFSFSKIQRGKEGGYMIWFFGNISTLIKNRQICFICCKRMSSLTVPVVLHLYAPNCSASSGKPPASTATVLADWMCQWRLELGLSSQIIPGKSDVLNWILITRHAIFGSAGEVQIALRGLHSYTL